TFRIIENNLLCAFFFYFSFSLLFHALSEQHFISKAMARITDCLHHKMMQDIIKSICKNLIDSLYFYIETWLLIEIQELITFTTT
ncbi:hypothetical protein ACJX0J_019246, partial [Zea mays]